MIKLGRGGFTIIEVVLFLAIAGMMLIVAMMSIGNRNQRVQFTDGVRAAEVFLERKYADIRNGSIDSRLDCEYIPATKELEFYPPDPAFERTGDCIFLGYIFEMSDFNNVPFGSGDNGTITAHQVVGRRLTSSLRAECGDDYIIMCAQPELSGITETFDIPWGVESHGAYSEANSRWTTFSFAFLRKPSSTSISKIAFLSSYSNPHPWENPSTLADLLDIDEASVDDGGGRDSLIEEGSINICLRSGDGRQYASMSLGSDFRGESIELSFEGNPSYAQNCLTDYAP